jgi:hypothetical protein
MFGDWDVVDDAAAVLDQFKVAPAFVEAGWDEYGEDLYGHLPAVSVHAGDLAIDGDLDLRDCDGYGVYIVDGSLRVGGSMVFCSSTYATIVVMGGLSAGHLLHGWDTHLVVHAATTVAGVIVIDNSDAGFTRLLGPVRARALWCPHDNNNIRLAGPAQIPLLLGHVPDAVGPGAPIADRLSDRAWIAAQAPYGPDLEALGELALAGDPIVNR